MNSPAIDHTRLRAALQDADPVLLLMSCVHLTGDTGLLERFEPHIRKLRQQSGSIPDDLKRDLHDRMMILLSHSPVTARMPDAVTLRRMVNVFLGEEIPAEYQSMLLDITRLSAGPFIPDTQPRKHAKASPGLPVVIAGAGPSGICAAVYLQRAGVPFVLIDKNPDIGGSWHENTYPGCGVDTASHFYSYSFAPNPEWPRYFSLQPGMMNYLNDVVERFGLRAHIRLGTSVESFVYDERAKHWAVTIKDTSGRTETLDARAIVSAVGQLSIPAVPDLKGLDSFTGPVVHTGAWDRQLDVRGKRVALVGTGSSSLQLGPTIAPEVASLTVFQRSPQWFSHKPDYHKPIDASTQWAFRHIPHYAQWYRLYLGWVSGDTIWPALLIDREKAPGVRVSRANDDLRKIWEAYLREKTAGDPQLLVDTLPDFPPLAKRVPVDNGWFDMLRRRNVRLVRKGIDAVSPHAVIASDGVVHEADIIVLATGFQASRMLQTMDIRGRDGQALRDFWEDDNPRANIGITVPGFPNLFILYGPNTNLGHGGNIIFHAECQANYMIACLQRLSEAGKSVIECKLDAYFRYVDAVDERIRGMVWMWPGVSNWFKNSKGRVTTNSPWRIAEYWAMTRDVDLKDYDMH